MSFTFDEFLGVYNYCSKLSELGIALDLAIRRYLEGRGSLETSFDQKRGDELIREVDTAFERPKPIDFESWTEHLADNDHKLTQETMLWLKSQDIDIIIFRGKVYNILE